MKNKYRLVIFLLLGFLANIFIFHTGLSESRTYFYGKQSKTKRILASRSSPSSDIAPSQSPSNDRTNSVTPESSPTDKETPFTPQVEPSELIAPSPVETSSTPEVGTTLTPVIVPTMTSPAPPTSFPRPSPTLTRPPKPTLSPEEQKIRKQNRAALAKRISNFVVNESNWRNCKVGIYCAVMDTGDEIYSKNGNVPMIPASNLKIITTAAALALLGPNFQFETSVWGGAIDKETGIMEGNLYLRGTGDPTFMDPFMSEPLSVFYKMVGVLKKRGVKEISGDIVGDDSAFDREFLGRGWKTRYLMDEYAAPAGALSINGNVVQVSVSANGASMIPSNSSIRIIRMPSKSGGFYMQRKLGTDDVYVYGNPGGTISRGFTVHNPSKFTTSVFAQILKKEGIKIKGKVRLIGDQDAKYMERTKKICYHLSPPLHKIIREINKESNNICAQHLFKAIGYYVKGKGTCENSNEAVREFLKEGGINPSGLIMADGSGLSEYNRISPRLFCDILSYMYAHPQGKIFYNSLSIGGKDGTLAYRNSDILVHAKTGTLTGHVGLSGYVMTRGKQIVVFSMLTNFHQYSNGAIRNSEDRLLHIIASCGDKL